MKVKSESEVAQSCSTLSDPMDCSLPASSVHGICQARVLEWAAIAFSTPMQIAVLRLVDNSITLWGGVSVDIPFLEWENNLKNNTHMYTASQVVVVVLLLLLLSCFSRV